MQKTQVETNTIDMVIAQNLSALNTQKIIHRKRETCTLNSMNAECLVEFSQTL